MQHAHRQEAAEEPTQHLTVPAIDLHQSSEYESQRNVLGEIGMRTSEEVQFVVLIGAPVGAASR